MKLNIKAVVIAEAVVGAALFVLCRVAFVLAPKGTLATLKYLIHIDWSPVTMPVTLDGFVFGLITFTIFLALVGTLWAWIYNWVAEGARVSDAVPSKQAGPGISHDYLHLGELNWDGEMHRKQQRMLYAARRLVREQQGNSCSTKGANTSARLAVGLNLKGTPRSTRNVRNQAMRRNEM